MKIAAVTDDGKTISQHFGRASHFLVVTIDNGAVVEQELRDKPGHQQFVNEPHNPESDRQGHGYGSGAGHRHGRMAQVISDCEAVLCRGMGRGAYDGMREYGIRPVLTEIAEIEPAVLAYADGTIVDRPDLLH